MVTQRWAIRVASLMLLVPTVHGNVSPKSLKEDPPDSANSITVATPNVRSLQECNFPIHNGTLFSKVFHNGDQWYEAGYGAIEVFWSLKTCQLVFGKNLGMFDPVNDNAFTYSGGTIRLAFLPQEVQKALDGGAFFSSVNEFYIRITTKYQLRNLSKNGFAYINRRTPDTKGYTLSSSFANIHQGPRGGNNPPFSLCTNNKVNDRDIPEADFVLCHDKQCTHDISSGAWSFVDCHVMVSDCYNAMLESCVQQTMKLRQFYPIGSFPEYRSFRRQYNVFVFFAGEDMTGGSYPTSLEDRIGSSGEVIMGHHAIPYDDEYGNGKYEVQFTIKRQDSAEISKSTVLGDLQVYSWAFSEVLQTLNFTASMVPVGSQWVNITMEVILKTEDLDDIGFGIEVHSGDQKIVYRSVRVTYVSYETFAPTMSPPKPSSFDLVANINFESTISTSSVNGAAAMSGDGNVIAISKDTKGHGYVEVYRNVGGTWTRMQYFDDYNNNEGSSLSLSYDGFTLAITAEGNYPSPTYGHTRVYWYDPNNNSYDFKGQYLGTLIGERAIGTALSSNGNILVQGSIGWSGMRGLAKVFSFNTVTSIWEQKGSTLLEPNRASLNYFGMSCSLSADGSVVAISAPVDPSKYRKGKVYVYNYETNINDWALKGNMLVGPHTRDLFGQSVDLNGVGSIIAIGSHYNNLAHLRAGAAFVYEYNSGTWVQMGSTLFGIAADDRFGRSVSISYSGLNLVVGAVTNEADQYTGRVSAYEYNGVDWDELGVNNALGQPGEKFGINIGMSDDGHRFIASVYGGGPSLGGVIFEAPTSSPSHALSVSPSLAPTYISIYRPIDFSFGSGLPSVYREGSLDKFSRCSISGDGNTVAITKHIVNGYVRTFKNTGGSWFELGQILVGDGAGDNFGWQTAFSYDGLTLGVVAQGFRETSSKIGYAQIFKYNGSTNKWDEKGNKLYFNAHDRPFSIDLSGNGDHFSIGMIGSDGNKGSNFVYVFNNGISDWNQKGSKILEPNRAQKNYFGWSTSISSDGSMIAVGKSNIPTKAKKGQVFIFKYVTDWTLSMTLTGPVNYDRFGKSVCLSGSGEVIAVGAPNANIDASLQGAVLVYQYSSSVNTWQQVGNTLKGQANDRFGEAVSISDSGSKLAVGAMNTNDKSGYIRMYEYVNSDWSEMEGEGLERGPGTSFGAFLTASNDGNKIATPIHGLNNEVSTIVYERKPPL